MSRRASGDRWCGLLGYGMAGFLGLAVLVVIGGCALEKETRLQSDADMERPKYDVKTIGDAVEYGNVDPVTVYGVALVTGLDNTGGNPPQGEYLRMLREELKKRDVKDYQKVLESPANSLVIVSGRIPAGARKGDTFDLEVTLPPGSKTTSLRGGYLQPCVLWEYQQAGNLSSRADLPNPERMIPGHPLARAEGYLQVGLGDGDQEVNAKQGRIWGGGRSRLNLDLHLLLKSDYAYGVVADNIANHINETFRTPYSGLSTNQVATAKNNTLVMLNVPEQYRHNLPRFLRVVRLIPMRDTATVAKRGSTTDEVAPGVTYRKQLHEDLLNPARTVVAALRLEALGNDSISVLKTGLTSDHAVVRFCSAESLAYLDSPSCGEELARLVESQPLLRAYSLTAMASMDQAICRVKLAELLGSPVPEARYGAFRALRAMDENEPAIKGQLLNHAFWVHHVAPDSPPMVHLSTSRRAEIVLFGQDAYLKPPFAIRAGDFAITATDDDTRCTIARCSTLEGTSHRQCSLKLDDVLRTLAHEGGMYPEAVELLKQAHGGGNLSCRVEVDALPQAISVYALAKVGLNKNAGEGGDEIDVEILNAKSDFGATPNLYEKDPGRRARSSAEREGENAVQDHTQQEPRK
jgi:hypothetical protein